MKKILVCEDNLMMAKAIEHKLRSEEYIVEVAVDGDQASENIDNSVYDLIMTDLLMPFTGGLQLINKIRNEKQLKVPIIVLSALGDEETIIEAFRLGADDYITKPFSPNELTVRVKRLLLKY